jgi:putative ABC transport system permease protein
MKNPLNKRIIREFKSDLGKYLVIFIFMVLFVGLISAFLVADKSITTSYDESFEKYNVEWGHFTLSDEVDEDFINELSEKTETEIYNLDYFEETEDKGANIRVYRSRDTINLACIMSGELPVNDDEIALDRMYAQNAEYEVGDTITLNGKKLKITGLVAVSDYSSLFENNTDAMFDSVKFSIAVMTSSGYDAVGSTNQFYNYAWMYKNEPEDDTAEKEMSDDFLEDLKSVLTDYDEALVMEQGYDAELVTVKDYVPRYNNQAINFAGDDMGGDKAMMIIFDYIVTVILAFVFAITISNTIVKEAGVIGTLRASGYSKPELIRHYMVLPVLVTLVAAIIGNLLGYTVLEKYMADLYYASYSLCTYETVLDAEAFVYTTVIPVILMFIINLVVLVYKMKFSPLDFLRRNLKKNKKKKALRLNTKIPIMHRFRMRIIFQNIPNYIVLFIGIQLAALIAVYGEMLEPMLDDYAAKVENGMISDYQYVLKSMDETDNEQAEKYCVTDLDSTDERYMTDEISVYGISDDSSYISADIPDGRVLVSNGIMDKFDFEPGDTITLKDSYGDDTYDFVIAGSYDYDSALAVFMTHDDFIEVFDKDDDYFTGYFSNELLTDIDDEKVATIVTVDDMTKVSRQLKVSMGSTMGIFDAFAIIMFILLMYILSKQIIEKNSQSISMTKILGFRDGEIGGLYIVATSIVVLISLLAAVPISDVTIKFLFNHYMYTMMTGYLPCTIVNSAFYFVICLGILCYIFVAAVQLLKIRKIPKSDALKNAE